MTLTSQQILLNLFTKETQDMQRSKSHVYATPISIDFSWAVCNVGYIFMIIQYKQAEEIWNCDLKAICNYSQQGLNFKKKSSLYIIYFFNGQSRFLLNVHL